jgi:hypothetical protein
MDAWFQRAAGGAAALPFTTVSGGRIFAAVAGGESAHPTIVYR